MKSRTFYSAIALFAGLLVLIGGVGFLGFTAQSPRVLLTQGGQEQALAAQFVPRQAPLMAALLARPDRLWQLRQLLTPANQRAAARQEWQLLQQSLENWVGWNYEADVRPWLGEEVTFAVTGADLDHNAENGLQPGYLAVLSCRDLEAAQAALHRLWQQRAAQRSLVFETVAGISLISDHPLTTPGMPRLSSTLNADLALETIATAIVGDRHVLVANNIQVLRQAIATYRAPDVSWSNADSYQTALSTLPPNRIGWVVANIPSLLAWLGVEEASPAQPIRPVGQQADVLFVSFQALADGLLGNTAIATALEDTAAPVKQPQSTKTTAAAAPLALLPDTALFATAGKNLNQRLQTLSDTIGGYRMTQEAIAALLQSWSQSIDPGTAVLAAPLQGEYALGLLPGETPSWALVTQATTAEIAALDDFAADQGLTVNHLNDDDQPITAWTRLSLERAQPGAALQLATQTVAVHTPLEKYEVLSTSLSGLQTILQRSSQDALIDQDTFAQLAEQVTTTTPAITYVDWPALWPILARQAPWLRALELATQPLSGHIGPVVIVSKDSPSPLKTGAIAIRLVQDPQELS